MKNSNSSISTYLRCPQLWKYTYVDRVEPTDSGSFEMSYGSSFHGLLEGDDGPISKFGPKWQAVIREHHHAYTKFWASNKDWPLTYHEHEVKFEFDLDGVTYHGIIDGVAELNGKNYLVESKTTGTKIFDYFQYMQNKMQPYFYLLAASECDILKPYDVQGCIIDVTRRPGCRQKKTENDTDYVQRVADWYFDNREVAFGRQLFEATPEYLHDLAADLAMISDLQRTNKFAKNRDSCYDYRKQCGFYQTCFGSEPLTSELYQVRKRR